MTTAHQRLGVVDFMRGVVIVDMMLVHYVHVLPGETLRKAIGYTDVAMEGFLALAGFMVGYHYLERYRRDRRGVARALLGRAVSLYGIHTLMVVTISLPLALAFGELVTGGEPVWRYVVGLLLLVKQEGLMHILPTFIPLFLAAIPVLSLVDRSLSWLVLAGSLAIFMTGNWQPYLLNLGDPSVFPVILWQVYFVLGFLAGARIRARGHVLFATVIAHVLVAAGLFLMVSWIRFGHHIAPVWELVRTQMHLHVRRFPLNLEGLLYGASLLSFVIGTIVYFRCQIAMSGFLEHTLTLMGRHSLLTFVIHVYFVKAAWAVSHLGGDPLLVTRTIATLNFIISPLFLNLLERRRAGHASLAAARRRISHPV